jgi:hypothetical protein
MLFNLTAMDFFSLNAREKAAKQVEGIRILADIGVRLLEALLG